VLSPFFFLRFSHSINKHPLVDHLSIDGRLYGGVQKFKTPFGLLPADGRLALLLPARINGNPFLGHSLVLLLALMKDGLVHVVKQILGQAQVGRLCSR
jgi:hypothetical protein